MQTERLTLIPFTRDLIQMAMRRKAELGRSLDAAVPDEWPGPDLEEILPFLDDAHAEQPERGQWITIIMRTADRVLIGSAGFKDLPDELGTVEIGYGLVAAYRGQGYATEAARALIDWAFAHQEVRRVGRDGDLLQWELLSGERGHRSSPAPGSAKGDP